MNITPTIRDATEAIDNIPALVDAITELLATPIGWVLLIVLFIWFVVNKKPYAIFEVGDKRERQRLEQLDAYVAKPEVADSDSLTVVRDIRDAHYFKLGTGIYAEKRWRASLIWLHEKTSHLISWKQIRYALPYIESTTKGEATVRDLKGIEKFGYWYNEAMAYLLLLAAASIFTLFLLSNLKSLTAIALGVGGATIAFGLAMFAFTQTFPEKTARRIKKELDKHLPCGEAPDTPRSR